MSATGTIRTGPALALLALAYAAFVSLGLPDGVLGVAWPSVRSTFGLPQAGLGAVLAGAGAGYVLSGLLAGRLVATFGVGSLLAASTGLMALAVLGYATAPVWPVFVLCAGLAGLGSGAIDASLNAYAAANFSVRHVNWLHAFFGLGATAGPLVATLVLTRGLSWRWGYAAVGAALLLLGLAFTATRRAWRLAGAGPAGSEPAGAAVPVRAALRHRLVWLQVCLFFVYTGVEFTLGQWSFTVLSEGRGLTPAVAGVWVSAYWGSLTVGRLLLGLIAQQLGPDRLVRLGTLGSLLGGLIFALDPLGLGVLGLGLVGFSLAPIFPTLMARTPDRLGAGVAVHAVGFQVSAAVLGGAALPSLAGALAVRFGLGSVGGVVLASALAMWLLHEALLRLSKAG